MRFDLVFRYAIFFAREMRDANANGIGYEMLMNVIGKI